MSPDTRSYGSHYLIWGATCTMALPKAWAEKSIEDIRVRGGYELDMEWKAGRLTKAVVRGVTNTNFKCRVQYGMQAKMLTVAKGKTQAFTPEDY